MEKIKKSKNIGTELRMYGIVPYNISDIQKGIQFGHAVVEYGLEYGHTPLYQDWAKDHKTFIILNGGTTNMNSSAYGTMQELAIELNTCVDTAEFFEPDLNDTLTAVVFIVEERVFSNDEFDLKNDFKADSHILEYFKERFKDFLELEQDPSNRKLYDNLFTPYMFKFFDFEEYLRNIGGCKNLRLKMILQNLKLA